MTYYVYINKNLLDKIWTYALYIYDIYVIMTLVWHTIIPAIWLPHNSLAVSAMELGIDVPTCTWLYVWNPPKFLAADQQA